MSRIRSQALIGRRSSYIVLAIVYEWQTKDKRPQRSNVNAMNLKLSQYLWNIVFSRTSIWVLLELVRRWTQHFTKVDQKKPRLRVVPHFSSGIVEGAKRERAWKSPHARKGDTRREERKMIYYRQSQSFWTYALLSQRKTLIGSSMEICQHLSKMRKPLSTLDIITIHRTNN